MMRFLLLSITFTLAIEAAEPSQAGLTRKRVGIALAGGGAKGLAHVGVIQWMQEHRVPIDAIAGTSMGGLVAGVYAGGRNSREIREFVDSIDWDTVLGSSAYTDLTFRRKEDQRAFPASLEFGIRHGQPRLPIGMNAGQQVSLLLERIGFDYSGIKSFDELPTPFRCVSADLLSGDEIVFEDGSLSLALRATMSLPAIFAPVAHKNMLLVDGGIVNNLPADVVRRMKVDTVIAVDLGIETLTMENQLSLLGVANRSIDILIRRNALASLKNADIVLKPSVLTFSTLGFKDVEQIIERGYQAAEAMSAELSKYSVSEDEWRQYLEERQRKTLPTSFTPEYVELTGLLDGERRLSEKTFRDLSNKPLDRNNLDKALTRIAGLGPYDGAYYREVEQNGKKGLEVEVSRKAYGPPFIRPLLVLDSGQAGNSSFTIGARITAFNTFTPNSEWRTDFSLGRIDSAGTEYYQFVGWRGLFVAPRAFVYREQQLLVDDGQRVADYKVRREGAGFDVGYNFGRFSEVRTGYEISRLRGDVQIGFPILPNVKGTEQLWSTRWQVNALNSGTVPTNGFLVNSELNWIFKSPTVYFLRQSMVPDSYGQAWSQFIIARPFSAKWSGLFRILGGGTFAGEAQPFSEFRLGGPMRLSALEFGELRGAYSAYGSASLLRRIYASPTGIFTKVYLVGAYETGDAFSSRLSLFHDGAAGIMAETKLGVLSVGFSYGESGRKGFYFSLGRILDAGVRNSFQVR